MRADRRASLWCRLVFASLSLALLIVFGMPCAALAKDYDIEQVDIDATVAADGSVTVLEQRTFDFDGSFHGVYWDIPTGSYGGVSIDTTVTTVGEIIDGNLVRFQEDYSGAEHTYELSDHGSVVRVKLYSSHDDERATFVIGYTDTNLAARYDDVSELYWKFVSDGWDKESQNVTCTVHLPVPQGAKVEPAENVRAWGHGPLDASVGFEGNDVVYRVPGVGTSEFAEARITFPADWLSATTSRGGKVLQDVLAEEQAWADEANARRERARMMVYGGSAVGLVGAVACIVASIFSMVRYRRTHKPHFDDKYFRDVPSNDHPAVLGALWRGGDVADEDFTATLMRLTDLGAVKLEQVTIEKKKSFGRIKREQDFRLSVLPQAADMPLGSIDRGALLTLFEDIGRFAKRYDDSAAGEVIYFSEIEKVAKKHPERFDRTYKGWQAKVQTELSKRHFFKSDRPTGRALASLCCVLTVTLFMATILFMLLTEAWLVCVGLLLLEIVGFVLSVVAIVTCKSVSDEAIELRAKLEALRRWLKDFTRLKEAVPRDVVLWNRLLVMAVALGVADEVIKQLQVAMPELLEDPMMYRTYGWYSYGPHGRPYQSFSNSYGTAHSVSAAALSSSSSSSGGGGGGGFSGGGGGGFGGGGGGGAF